jgi:xanthine/CO dehydrogenase XdhC/CoxF family maturation factor
MPTRALAGGAPVALRYGRGSPFGDIQLPCGGGLDILLVPRPDPAVMAALLDRRAGAAARDTGGGPGNRRAVAARERRNRLGGRTGF